LRDQPLSPEELANLEPYEDAIIANESVEPIVGTNLFTIKFRHHDPELAQKVANTLAEVFKNHNLERATSNSTRAEDLLAREIADLQMKIRHDQEVQFNYAREHNLPLNNEGANNVEVQRLNNLSNQLLEAENQRKTAQAVYESAKAATDPF